MIQIHPVGFTDYSSGVSVQYVYRTDTQYIDPDHVEGCEEWKAEDLWLLNMASNRVIGIKTEEFLKFKHLLFG